MTEQAYRSGARVAGPGAPRVLVPVKSLGAAKSRLAGVLTPDQRRGLVLAMLQDVLAAINGAGLTELGVVSPDRQVLELAASCGARPVRQRSPEATLNEALDEAAAVAAPATQPLLVVPADVPLATADELVALVAASAQAGFGAPTDAVVALVPDRAGGGTNALLRRPADVIPALFGTASLDRHRAAAAAAGVPCRVRRLPGLAHDLDTPADLTAFRAHPTDTHAYRFLVRLGADQAGGSLGPAPSRGVP